MPAPSDLVHETTTSTGALTLVLTNVNGCRSFNTAFGTGGANVFDYFISARDTADWERGTGSLSSTSTLVRDTVLASSNGGAAVNFTTGIKDITNDIPAALQARLDAAQTWTGSNTFSAAINLTSGQIIFPAAQAASAGANTLDDYEEGTFTPTIKGSTTAGTNTYTDQVGHYVKVGQAVIASFKILMATKDGAMAGSFAKVAGFPFPGLLASLNQGTQMPDWGNFSANQIAVGLLMQTNDTEAFITLAPAAAAVIALATPANITATTLIGGTLCYRANA